MDPLIIGFIVFALILAGAFAGWAIRQCLPAHHLSDETKSLVSVSMAVVATVSALVLGLLISNANTSFRALGGEVTTLSAQILRLDQILRRYGPDTDAAREMLRQYAEDKTADLFPDGSNRPIRRMRSPCCARAASGHAAAPPSNVMNSRRSIIRLSRRRGRTKAAGQ